MTSQRTTVLQTNIPLLSYGNSLALHCAPSTAHNIAISKMGAVLPTSAKRTNKGSFCRAKASIRNNNAGDQLTASWFAIELNEAMLLI